MLSQVGILGLFKIRSQTNVMVLCLQFFEKLPAILKLGNRLVRLF